MSTRRSRGEGGLHWDEARQRWIATVTLGFDARGKRITRKASGLTKTAAKHKLKEILRDHDDGLATEPHGYTVSDAVRNWLSYGFNGRSAPTIVNYTGLAEEHIVSSLGARRLRDLSAEEFDRRLKTKIKTLSTRSLRLLHSLLNRAVKHAQARDKVKRNVVVLCEVPTGQQGRPSKALTLAQAEAVLAAAENSPLQAYIILSLLIGARTEETARPDLARRRHRRPTRRPTSRATVDLSPAIGPDRGRHEDPEVTPTVTDAAALCGGATPSAHPPIRGRGQGRNPLGREQPRLHLQCRHGARCAQRPPRLPRHRRGSRISGRSVDSEGDAAQFRVAALRLGRTDRAHLSAGRSQWDRRHRDRLPAADPPGHGGGATAMDSIFPTGGDAA